MRALHWLVDCSEKLTGAATLLLTIGLVVLAYYQWAALHNTDVGVHKQAVTMEKQLQQMEKQIGEMEAARKKTDELIENNRRLANAAKEQADHLKLQVEVSEKATKANQRAWVGPVSVEIVSGRQGGEPPLKSLSVNQAIKFEVVYRNTGREPARELAYDFDVVSGDKSEDYPDNSDSSQLTAFRNECSSWKIRRSQTAPNRGAVVYPNDQSSQNFMYVTPNKEFAVDAKILSGDKWIFLHGCFV